MTDAVAAAIAAAQNAAAQTPQNTGGTDVSTSQQAMNTLPAQGGQTRSLDDFIAGAGMTVEAYLAVIAEGLRIGKDLKVHDELIVKLNVKDIKVGYTLRVNTGSGVNYYTSWDGFAENRTRENWQKIIADAKKIDPNSYVSDLLEVPVVLQEDYALKGPPAGVAPAGMVVGMSLSYQNAKFATPFIKKIKAEYGDDADLIVKLTSKPRVGGGQNYGTFEFDVVRDDGQMVEAKPTEKKAGK